MWLLPGHFLKTKMHILTNFSRKILLFSKINKSLANYLFEDTKKKRYTNQRYLKKHELTLPYLKFSMQWCDIKILVAQYGHVHFREVSNVVYSWWPCPQKVMFYRLFSSLLCGGYSVSALESDLKKIYACRNWENYLSLYIFFKICNILISLARSHTSP